MLTVMKKQLIAGAVLIALGSVQLAVHSTKPTVAEDKPPLVTQVENHEIRITDLEAKTDETQNQVNQNTADISAVQDKTGIAPAPKVQAVQTTVAQPTTQTNAVTTEQTPEPKPDPRTITSFTDTPNPKGLSTDEATHTCSYRVVFDNGKYEYLSSQYASNPCLQVGELYPYNIPGMY